MSAGLVSNFTSLDPIEKARGISSLQGASKLDREIWIEFENRLEQLAEQTEPLLLPSSNNLDVEGPTEISTIAKRRLHQSFFRRVVLGSYESRCCITGNPISRLLRASHIIPWAKSEDHRLDPSNGLCLAATHDAAFDQGLITLDSDCRLVLAKAIKEALPNDELNREFIAFEGKVICLPEKNLPSLTALEWHRDHIFEN